MARVKLSEYRAKSLLVSGYKGVAISIATLSDDLAQLNEGENYIIKVDQGIKKRGKQGLIRLTASKDDAKKAIEELSESGFSRFIAEPMLPHEDNEEQYVSFERTREGIVIHHSPKGGIDIEDNPESVATYTPETMPLPEHFTRHVIDTMNTEHLSFVEINPLVVREDECILLDAAVLADSAGEYISSWDEDDIVEARTLTRSEQAIAELNNNSPASFSFRVIDPQGSLWLICFGGGASITVADEAMNQGRAELMGNFGEYSGATVEESYLYTKALVDAMLQSDTPKKALVIAGGVANFTDIRATFKGIVQLLEEQKVVLQEQNVKVFVRRGGPNEKEGLALMEKFLKENNLYGSVHGADIVLTDVINEALEYIDA